MKYLPKIALALTIITVALAGCDKVGPLPHYNDGSASSLSATVTEVAATPADSLSDVITFNWTEPNYATDITTEKFILQIDSAGRNFSKAYSRTLVGELSSTFTAKQLNDILLGYGFSFGVAYDMDVRIISSYGNNNQQLTSNTLTIKITPYKIPPKVAPPTSGKLFLVGSATQGGWTNPVPVPSQEFEQVDSVTYGGVFNLNGGNEYLILPVNGDWSHKYSVADKTVPGLSAGGSFGYDLNDNIPGPATSGWYKIMVDFQHGTFAVTPYTSFLPENLYITGDATPGGWTNPVPVPSQQFTRINSTQFQLTLNMNGGKQYLMLPVNGDWSHKFSVNDNTIPGLENGGDFGYDLPQNFPGPSTDGSYNITADFLNYTFKVTH